MKALEAKVVVLGTQGVGKTSIVVRYVGKIFSNKVSPTVGSSFFTFKMTVDNYRVKIQLWDTAGQERFRSMAPMYYRRANAAFIVYDITNYESFESVKSWVEELKKNVETPIVMCLLGNKSDLDDQRKVSRDEGVQFAASIGALFFETSALTDDGIQEAFLRLSLTLISLSQSAPNCGLVVKEYDSSRRRSADIVTVPPSLKLLRDRIAAEEDIKEEAVRQKGSSCCQIQ